MTSITDIKDPNWSLSTLQQGEVVVGDVDIAQSIAIILRTRKGSDPLRPFFGSDIARHIDKPISIGAPMIVNEIINSLKTWEPRIQVLGVAYVLDESNVRFVISWKRKTEGGGINVSELVSVTNYNDQQLSFGDFNFDYSFDFDI